MKKIGIIGGLSPESTMKYYEGLNQGAQARLGGLHNAKIILSSVDFGEFVALKDAGDWETQAALLVAEAQALERGGADFIILATNTMHKMAQQIQEAISIPFLHLADATAEKIVQAGINNVGLLGTRFTMEEDFYKARLRDAGIEAIVPDAAGIEAVSRIIYDELCKGVVREDSRDIYRSVIADFQKTGAQGVVLGCTEITMLISQKDVEIPVFDTTKIHVEAALEKAFGI
jgi:aspartate racemase